MSLNSNNQQLPVRLLVIDDEPMMRRLMQRTLEKRGALVTLADGPDQARLIIETQGCSSYDVVISDYMMPGETGLSLITWLKTKDSSLSAIIVTAETDERNLATQTLRAGGLDFLEKPIDTSALVAAIDKAADRTRKLRNYIATDSQVKSIAEVQNDLIDRQSQLYPGRFGVFFRPRHEAGGDFFRVIPGGDKIFEVLVGDVSGHDLRAAFVSAYFQGIARGMKERGSSSLEVFRYFNSFLMREWNDQSAEFPRLTSISACSIRVNLINNTAIMVGCGCPTPLLLTTTGQLRPLGDCSGPPLGWLDDYNAQEFQDSLDGAACLYVWTDGLDDLARQEQLNLATVLFLLLHQKRNDFAPLNKTEAFADDILAARIWIRNPSSEESGFWPFFSDTCIQTQIDQIDRLQADWERSLTAVFNDIAPEHFHDILLATREAVLNALKHGCQNSPSHSMTLQMSCHPENKTVRVRISDDGPGHNFDWDFHDKQSDLMEGHRGLLLIGRLSQRVHAERNGATLVMDFDLNPLKDTNN